MEISKLSLLNACMNFVIHNCYAKPFFKQVFWNQAITFNDSWFCVPPTFSHMVLHLDNLDTLVLMTNICSGFKLEKVAEEYVVFELRFITVDPSKFLNFSCALLNSWWKSSFLIFYTDSLSK